MKWKCSEKRLLIQHFFIDWQMLVICSILISCELTNWQEKAGLTKFLYKKCPMEPVLQISKEFVTGVEEQGGSKVRWLPELSLLPVCRRKQVENPLINTLTLWFLDNSSSIWLECFVSFSSRRRWPAPWLLNSPPLPLSSSKLEVPKRWLSWDLA